MRAPAYFLGDPILFKGDTYCMNQELCTLYTSPNNNNNKMSRQLLFGQVTEMQHWFTENKFAKDFFFTKHRSFQENSSKRCTGNLALFKHPASYWIWRPDIRLNVRAESFLTMVRNFPPLENTKFHRGYQNTADKYCWMLRGIFLQKYLVLVEQMNGYPIILTT